MVNSSRPNGFTFADSTFKATGSLLSGENLCPFSTLATIPYTKAVWKVFITGPAFSLRRRPARVPPIIVRVSLLVPTGVDGIDPLIEYERPAVGWV